MQTSDNTTEQRNGGESVPRSVGITAAIVSGVLIAAHFLRAGSFPLVVLGLAFPWLLFVRKSWARWTVQLLLVLAAAEWLHTLLVIVNQRQANGQPWTRTAVILGIVALFTVASAFAIRKRSGAGVK